MTALVFGEADPARYNVPASECLACGHPSADHAFGDDGLPTCMPTVEAGRCGCDRYQCASCRGIAEECACEEED